MKSADLALNATNYGKRRETLSRLARAAVGGLITVEDAARALDVAPRIATARMRRLAAQGWLARAQRGVYLVRPLEALGTSGSTVDDPWLLGHQLFAPCYVGGWSAAEHWGLTEQFFRSTFIVSAAGRRRRNETKLSAEFRVVRVPRARVETVGTIWRGPVRVRVSDRERTLADGLMHPAWLGGLRHLAEMLRTYRLDSHFQPLSLLKHLQSLQAGAGIKRLGFLAELLWPNQKELIACALEQTSKGIIKLDPGVVGGGRISSRWSVRVNVDVGGDVE